MQFSDKERRALEANPLVKAVSESTVQFSTKFKLKALQLQAQGLKPRGVFLKLGVDPNLFLEGYPKKCLDRWKRIVREVGEEGLKEERRGKKATGRPKKPRLETEKALRARIALLEAENDFLKKLKALVEDEKLT